ncbi:MAG: DASS family sodium-coupled anion symporter [Tissierellia bacterium]|nr:DASS family sodium-coupled anion symporter [Tissierellia bacterium]
MKKDNLKKWIGRIVIFGGFFILRNFIPEGLDQKGWDGFLVLFLTVLLWITEAVPMGVTAVFALFFAGFIGFETQENILKGFSGTGVFFLLSAMTIGQIFTNVGLGKRLSLYILPMLGKKAKNVLLSVMLGTGIISMFLADIPTALIFYGITMPILAENGLKPGESNYGKAMMLGIPIAAAFGGIGTPAGSGMNAVTMSLFKNLTGLDISFTAWSLVGAPIALVSIFFSWLILCLVYKPEIEVVKGLENAQKNREEIGPLSSKEKKFGIIFLIMIFFWFFPDLVGINMYITSWFGVFIMALPGMDLFDWETTVKKIDWNAFLICFTATALATVVSNLGTGEWLSGILTDLFLGDVANKGLFLLVLIINFMMMIGHYPMPQGLSLVGLLLPVVVALSDSLGINPLALGLPVAMSTSMLLLVPIDPTCFTTYSGGYWKIKDMMFIGVLVTTVYVFINTFWVVIVENLGMI